MINIPNILTSSSSHTFPVLRTNPEAPFSHGSKAADLSTNERRAFPHGGKSQPPHPSQNVCSKHIPAQPSELTTPPHHENKKTNETLRLQCLWTER